MSNRQYTYSFENQAVAAAVDIFEWAPADDRPIELCGLFIAVVSEVASNVGEDEFLRFKIIRGHATSGSGGAATTGRPLDPVDVAAGATCETLNTTIASAGTPVDLHADAFNVRTGYQMWWPTDFGPKCSQIEGTLVVRLMAAPADSVNMTATAYVNLD